MVPMLFSSFSRSKACEYAGSNIDYIRTQTSKAIDTDDLNLSKYLAYKAINAIEKSKKQFELCGCDYANDFLSESSENLILATKSMTLRSAKIFLERALENAIGGQEALEHHSLHKSTYASDVLALNTKELKDASKNKKQDIDLYKKIDASLKNYESSLEDVVNTVDCLEARDFALGIYKNCENQLVNPDLTDAKKYYHLKTKEITLRALNKLKDCMQ